MQTTGEGTKRSSRCGGAATFRGPVVNRSSHTQASWFQEPSKHALCHWIYAYGSSQPIDTIPVASHSTFTCPFEQRSLMFIPQPFSCSLLTRLAAAAAVATAVRTLLLSQNIDHAVAILSFYLSGSTVQGSCANRLAKLLHLPSIPGVTNELIRALARVLWQILVDLNVDPSNQLGGCAPDVPAVILSLAASTCPSQGFLWNLPIPPLPAGSPATIPCQVSRGVLDMYGAIQGKTDRGLGSRGLEETPV